MHVHGFSVSILELTNCNTAAGKTGYQPSAGICHWTAADMDHISADADVKMISYAHLCTTYIIS